MRKLDLIGEVYGRLIVIKEGGRTNQNAIKWVCLCDCGNIKEVSIGHLRYGDTRSCGCWEMENRKKSKKKHGETAAKKKISVEYYAWRSMKDRCTNPKYEYYSNYGGRGISVCERWDKSFANFLDDMGRRPIEKESLDRYPDVNGNYEPGNCRWATSKEQAGNKTNNKWIEYNGKKMIQADWARELNIDVRKLHHCLKTWSLKEVDEMLKNGGIINKREKPYNKTYYKNPARAMLGRTGAQHKGSKKINQIHKTTGEIIETFDSIRQAQLKIGTSLSSALRGITKTAAGYKWEYA